MAELVDVLGVQQPTELVHSHVAQRHIVRQLVAHDLRGGLRQDDLTTVGETTQARTPMYGRTLVVSLRQFGFPRVQRHPNADRCAVGPLLGEHRALERKGAPERIAGPGERGERAVPLTLVSGAATAERREVFGHEGVVALEPGPRPAGVGLPDSCRPLDVGEEKRHHARRQRGLAHQPSTLLLGSLPAIGREPPRTWRNRRATVVRG